MRKYRNNEEESSNLMMLPGACSSKNYLTSDTFFFKIFFNWLGATNVGSEEGVR